MLAVSARRSCSPWNAGPTQSVEDFVVAGDRDAASPRVSGCGRLFRRLHQRRPDQDVVPGPWQHHGAIRIHPVQSAAVVSRYHILGQHA